MSLFHCIYTSVQTRPLPEAEIAGLMRASRMKNADHGISGLLLHVQDTFFQVLEGPQEALDALWSDIVRDDRHNRVTRIIYEPIPHRFFAEQPMGLANLSPSELATIVENGGTQRREELLSDLDEGRAKRLLRAFAEGRWRGHLRSTPQMAVRA